LEACLPLGPVVTSNVTFMPSCRLLKPLPWIAEKCAKRSSPPPSGVMKPKPLASLNHLTVPVAMLRISFKNECGDIACISWFCLELQTCRTPTLNLQRPLYISGNCNFVPVCRSKSAALDSAWNAVTHYSWVFPDIFASKPAWILRGCVFLRENHVVVLTMHPTGSSIRRLGEVLAA
jgi:hypothetical protein